MNAASQQRYPAGQFKPAVALQKIAACSTSNQVATSGCAKAGTAYTIELPASCIPESECQVHRGGALVENERGQRSRGSGSVPENIFRSFRKFFGGK
jgi:penicillin-binding protein 1A